MPTDSHPGDRSVAHAAVMFALLTLLLGLGYSLAGTALGYALFRDTARGSLIERGGQAVGSALVAQPFADPRYFQPRPSAAGYDPMAVAGSNQARTHPALRERVAEAVGAVAVREGIAPAEVPSDLVTQSGSGIDPHLSPAAVRIQIARVAAARAMPRTQVEGLVAEHTEPPQWGVLGQPRINVLELNLALDAANHAPPTAVPSQAAQ